LPGSAALDSAEKDKVVEGLNGEEMKTGEIFQPQLALSASLEIPHSADSKSAKREEKGDHTARRYDDGDYEEDLEDGVQ